MSIFNNIKSLFAGQGSAVEAAAGMVPASALEEANARIEELQNQPAPEPVRIEVPVPQEMVSVVALQFQHKTSSLTAAQYAGFVGMSVKDFVQQIFPDADISRISQISIVTPNGGSTTRLMTETMPADVPASIGVSQTSGRGE